MHTQTFRAHTHTHTHTHTHKHAHTNLPHTQSCTQCSTSVTCNPFKHALSAQLQTHCSTSLIKLTAQLRTCTHCSTSVTCKAQCCHKGGQLSKCPDLLLLTFKGQPLTHQLIKLEQSSFKLELKYELPEYMLR